MSAVAGSHAHVFYLLAEGSQRSLRGNHARIFQLACTNAILPITKYIHASGVESKVDFKNEDGLALDVFLNGRPDTLQFLASKDFGISKEEKGNEAKSANRILKPGELIYVNFPDDVYPLKEEDIFKHAAMIVKHIHNGPAALKRKKHVYVIRYFYPKYLHFNPSEAIDLKIDKNMKQLPETGMIKNFRRVLVTKQAYDAEEENKWDLTQKEWFSKKKKRREAIYEQYDLTPYEEVRWGLNAKHLLPSNWMDRFQKEKPTNDKRNIRRKDRATRIRFSDAKEYKIGVEGESAELSGDPKLKAAEMIGLLEKPPDFAPFLNYTDFLSWSFRYNSLARFLTILPGPPLDALHKFRGLKYKYENPQRLKQLYVNRRGTIVAPESESVPDIIYDNDGLPLFYHMELIIKNAAKEYRRGWVLRPEHLVIQLDGKGDEIRRNTAPSWELIRKFGPSSKGGYQAAMYEITHPYVYFYRERVKDHTKGDLSRFEASPNFRDLYEDGSIAAIREGTVTYVTGSLDEFETFGCTETHAKDYKNTILLEAGRGIRQHRESQIIENQRRTLIARKGSLAFVQHNAGRVHNISLYRTKEHGWILGEHLAVKQSYDMDRHTPVNFSNRMDELLSPVGIGFHDNDQLKRKEFVYVWHPPWGRALCLHGISPKSKVEEVRRAVKDAVEAEKERVRELHFFREEERKKRKKALSKLGAASSRKISLPGQKPDTDRKDASVSNDGKNVTQLTVEDEPLNLESELSKWVLPQTPWKLAKCRRSDDGFDRPFYETDLTKEVSVRNMDLEVLYNEAATLADYQLLVKSSALPGTVRSPVSKASARNSIENRFSLTEGGSTNKPSGLKQTLINLKKKKLQKFLDQDEDNDEWKLTSFSNKGSNKVIFIVEPNVRLHWFKRDALESKGSGAVDKSLNSWELQKAWQNGIRERKKQRLAESDEKGVETKAKAQQRSSERRGGHELGSPRENSVLHDDLKKAIRDCVQREILYYRRMGWSEALQEVYEFFGGWDDQQVSEGDRQILVYGLTEEDVLRAVDSAIPDVQLSAGQDAKSKSPIGYKGDNGFELSFADDDDLEDEDWRKRYFKVLKNPKIRRRLDQYKTAAKRRVITAFLKLAYNCGPKQKYKSPAYDVDVKAVFKDLHLSSMYLMEHPDLDYDVEIKKEVQREAQRLRAIEGEGEEESYGYVKRKLDAKTDSEERMKPEIEFVLMVKKYFEHHWHDILKWIKAALVKEVNKEGRVMHVYQVQKETDELLVPSQRQLLDKSEFPLYSEKYRILKAVTREEEASVFHSHTDDQYYRTMEQGREEEHLFLRKLNLVRKVKSPMSQAGKGSSRKGMMSLEQQPLKDLRKMTPPMETGGGGRYGKMSTIYSDYERGERLRTALFFQTYQEGSRNQDPLFLSQAMDAVVIASRALKAYSAAFQLYHKVEAMQAFIDLYERFEVDPLEWINRAVLYDAAAIHDTYQSMLHCKMFLAFGRMHRKEVEQERDNLRSA